MPAPLPPDSSPAPADPPPVIGFVAPSGTGKTTLIARLVPVLRERGLRVGYLKHTHHRFELDRPGKDSHVVSNAGAVQTMIASADAWGLISRGPISTPATPSQGAHRDADADLTALLARYDAAALDLVMIEGFHGARYPKLEVHRAATGKPLLFPNDDSIIAVVTDSPLPAAPHPPVLALDDLGAIADFIVTHRAGAAPVAAVPALWPAATTPAGTATEDLRTALLHYACDLYRSGNPDATLGSASVRQGERFWIVPDAAQRIATDRLCADDLITCRLDGPIPERAAYDAVIHQAVYTRNPKAAVMLRTHGPYAVAVGFSGRDFKPADLDAQRQLHSVPVLNIAPQQLLERGPRQVAQALAEHPVCIIAGQGVYARGTTLRQALHWTRLLELSARIYIIGREAMAT